VVQRRVMPHPCAGREFGHFCRHATEATPSRLTAEQGRYSAAAVNATAQRLAVRGAVNTNGGDLSVDLGLATTGLMKCLGCSSVLRNS